MGHNLGKNHWIETKLKLDLYRRKEKKVWKTDFSFKGHNSSKIGR
jgi:hypothetical protein